MANIAFKILVFLFKFLVFPFYLLMCLVDEISGEGRWYSRQRQRMESERPALSDPDFLESVGARPEHAPLWLAVRRAVADAIGLRPEANYPQDRLADLWRMQWLGPDFLDILFRLEKQLSYKVPRGTIEAAEACMRHNRRGEFRGFAEAVVHGLVELSKTTDT